MSVIKCCRDCISRYHACHDFCERYRKEKAESQEARDKRLRFYQTEHDLSSIKKRKKK